MTDQTTVRAVELGRHDDHASSLREQHAIYGELHKGGCPVAHSDAHGGYYMLAGYQEVKQSAGAWKTFSSAGGTNLPKAPIRIAALEFDPPDHAFWRDIYREVLNLGTYRSFEKRVEEQVAALIDAFVTRGHAELVAELTSVVPVTTICEIIGIQDAERAMAARRIALETFDLVGDPPALGAALGRFAGFCMEEVDARRRQPREDFLTRLGTEPVDGALLTDDQIVNLVISFLIGGHHSTTSAMTSLLAHVAADPALRDRLIADPELIPRAVEETIRLDTPLHGFYRQTTCPVDVAGVAIPEGSEVQLNYGAANRDPSVYAAPAQFDLDRPSTAHLGFGHGIHTCVGAQLARLELRLTLQQVLARLPDLTLATPLDESLWSGGHLQALPRLDITFTAE